VFVGFPFPYPSPKLILPNFSVPLRKLPRSVLPFNGLVIQLSQYTFGICFFCTLFPNTLELCEPVCLCPLSPAPPFDCPLQGGGEHVLQLHTDKKHTRSLFNRWHPSPSPIRIPHYPRVPLFAELEHYSPS